MGKDSEMPRSAFGVGFEDAAAAAVGVESSSSSVSPDSSFESISDSEELESPLSSWASWFALLTSHSGGLEIYLT